MPYIVQEKRKEMNETIMSLSQLITTEGDLNYAITALSHLFLGKGKYDYARLNTIIGVLSCAQHEFYKEVVVPYENKKINDNGNINILDF